MREKLKFQNNQQCYSLLEPVPKTWSLLFYLKSICIGIWVLFKWLIFFLWNNIYQKKSNEQKSSHYYDGYHDKPPSILVDNKIGRQSYVKLKGVKFHYVEAGSYENPLILLLHGFPDCWLGWHNQITDLSRFFRVVAIDLKGFNDSEKPSWRQAYSPKQICEELRQFIFSLGCSSTTIIGHDLGALIGWYFAHTNPENIERFICVSSPHPNLIWTNLNSKSIMNLSWLQFIQLPFLPELDHSSPHTNFLQNSFKFLLINKNNNNNSSNYRLADNNQRINNDQIMDSYYYIFNRRNDWTGPLNYYRNLPFYRIKEGSIVRCPVLIITGNDDEFCRLEMMVKSAEYCNNPVLKIINGSGHWPQQQNPDDFNLIILNFLVGNRAKISPTIEKTSNKSIVSRMFGAVSTSVKLGTSVLDSVQQKTNEVLNNATSI